MRLLLDTQALILAGQNRLPRRAAQAFTSADNTVYFSLGSLWEIGIKAGLKKLAFQRKLTDYHDALIGEGLIALPIEVAHLERAVGLPRHHKDPFDHLLIGQALLEHLTVLTGDVIFEAYGCRRLWD